MKEDRNLRKVILYLEKQVKYLRGEVLSGGGGGGGNTNLTNTPSASGVAINSSTGSSTTVLAATTTLAGMMSAADKVKVETGFVPYAGATADVDLGTHGIKAGLFNDAEIKRFGGNNTTVTLGVDNYKNNSTLLSVAIGYKAGENTTGSSHHSVLIGNSAGQDCSVTSVVGIGSEALGLNTGGNSVGIGYQAGKNNEGSRCTGVGDKALSRNKGSNVSAIGANTAERNIGNNCVGIGNSSLSESIGDFCTGIGISSLMFNAGEKNTAIGSNAYSTFIEDVAKAKSVANSVTDINTTLNQITIVAHGFGAINEYVTLLYTPTSTVIGGLHAHTK